MVWLSVGISTDVDVNVDVDVQVGVGAGVIIDAELSAQIQALVTAGVSADVKTGLDVCVAGKSAVEIELDVRAELACWLFDVSVGVDVDVSEVGPGVAGWLCGAEGKERDCTCDW